MFPQNFRTEPFTQEELARFTKALSLGRVQDVVSLLSEATPEKEIEIQKLVNHFSPIYKGYEQKVKGFLDQLQSRENLQITEPQQEEKIDRLIRQELTHVKNKNKIEAAINELNSLKVTSEEEAKKISETIKEHKKLLKKMESEVAESLTLENVKEILKTSTVDANAVHVVPPVPNGLSRTEEVIEVAKEEAKVEVKEKVKTEKLDEKPLEESKLDELAKSEKPVEEVKAEEPKPEEATEAKVEEVKVEATEPAVVGTGKKAKECCGSKGHAHKKNCPLKNK